MRVVRELEALAARADELRRSCANVESIGDESSLAELIAQQDALIDQLTARADATTGLLDACPYAIAVHDPSGCQLFANLGARSGAQPAVSAEFLARVARVGEPVLDVEYEAPHDPSRFQVSSGVVLPASDGRAGNVLSVTRESTERVRDDEAARERATRFRDLAMLSPDAMVVHGSGCIRFANNAAARMLGATTPSDLVGRPVMDFVAPPWREALAARHLRTYASVTTPGMEHGVVRLDGSELFAATVGVPIEWDGEDCALTVAQDVTLRKAAEDAANVHDRRAQLAVANLPGAAFRLRHEFEPGRPVKSYLDFISDGSRKLLGFAPEALMGEIQLDQFVHPEDRPGQPKVLDYEVGQKLERRFRMRRADGGWRWVLQASRCVDIGDSVVVEGIFIDIEPRIRAERALAARTALLQSVIDAVPGAGIAMQDREGRYLLINETAAGFLGLRDRRSEVVGARLDDLVPGSGSSVRAQVHDQVLQTGEPVVGREYESRRWPGVWRMLNAAPVMDDSGRVEAVVQAEIDITARKLAQQVVTRQREELEYRVQARSRELSEQITQRQQAQQALAASERLAATGAVAATLSHELRHPLGTIQNMLYALGTSEKNESPQWDAAQAQARGSIERCLRTIDELLAYAEPRPLDKVSVELDQWAKQVVADISAPSAVMIESTLASGARVAIDTQRLRLAVLTLVRNAFEAVEEQSSARVSFTTRADGHRALIIVADNGPGIAPESRERVFEPMFSTRPFGMGLGLPLARRIVEDHGGELALDSDVSGTRVTLDLPVSGAAQC